MSTEVVAQIVREYGKDSSRLMDIVRKVQERFSYVSDEAVGQIAGELGLHRVQVEDMASFYSFIERRKKGTYIIRLSGGVVDRMRGMPEVAAAFTKALGIPVGGTTPDGTITLEYTSDICMSDQAPAAMINGMVLTNLSPQGVPAIVDALRKGKPAKGSEFPGTGSGTTDFPNAEVELNLRQPGPVVFDPIENGAAIRKALNLTPEQLIDEVTKSRLRGRGGAGFPTGMKWGFCRKAQGKERFLVCNADEGEPGTFKDRVILTEVADSLIEGMTIGGYAIGAKLGLLYLRAEYQYLWGHVEQVLARRRRTGLLGENICGRQGFDFDIRVQLGAGAYICGEESGLIESLEGKRGAPRDRPPFPVQCGYLNQPTSVNNVETLCCVAKILEKGADWFSKIGTQDSTGTKLLSVSGDCRRPGVYEVDYGITIDKLLQLVDAENAQAVQIGGPSGQCIAPKDFGRRICFEDLPTGGSVIVVGQKRDLLEIVREFTEFFVEESCGWCAPCRVGTTLLLRKLEKILAGKGTQTDIEDLKTLGKTVTTMSRCGLGQTAANPILTTLRNFPELFNKRVKAGDFIPSFDLQSALQASYAITGRKPQEAAK